MTNIEEDLKDCRFMAVEDIQSWLTHHNITDPNTLTDAAVGDLESKINQITEDAFVEGSNATLRAQEDKAHKLALDEFLQ